MNVRSLFLIKKYEMKNLLLIKVCLIFPVLLFSSYTVMAALGNIASFMGCSNDFFCGPFCLIGKIVLGLSAILFFFLIFPDIKSILNILKNAPTKEK